MAIMNWIHPGEVAAHIRGLQRTQASRNKDHQPLTSMA